MRFKTDVDEEAAGVLDNVGAGCDLFVGIGAEADGQLESADGSAVYDGAGPLGFDGFDGDLCGDAVYDDSISGKGRKQSKRTNLIFQLCVGRQNS